MKIELVPYEDVDVSMHHELLALRNSDRVRMVSFDRSIIALDEHLSWVAALRQRRDVRYYAVLRDGGFVGSLNFTAIEPARRSLEWGASFKEDALFIPALVIFEMLERVFFRLDFSTVFLSVDLRNERAIKTNRRFGFQESGALDINGNEYIRMVLSSSNWLNLRDTPGMRALHELLGRNEVTWADETKPESAR